MEVDLLLRGLGNRTVDVYQPILRSTGKVFYSLLAKIITQLYDAAHESAKKKGAAKVDKADIVSIVAHFFGNKYDGLAEGAIRAPSTTWVQITAKNASLVKLTNEAVSYFVKVVREIGMDMKNTIRNESRGCVRVAHLVCGLQASATFGHLFIEDLKQFQESEYATLEDLAREWDGGRSGVLTFGWVEAAGEDPNKLPGLGENASLKEIVLYKTAREEPKTWRHDVFQKYIAGIDSLEEFFRTTRDTIRKCKKYEGDWGQSIGINKAINTNELYLLYKYFDGAEDILDFVHVSQAMCMEEFYESVQNMCEGLSFVPIQDIDYDFCFGGYDLDTGSILCIDIECKSFQVVSPGIIPMLKIYVKEVEEAFIANGNKQLDEAWLPTYKYEPQDIQQAFPEMWCRLRQVIAVDDSDGEEETDEHA